MTAKWYAAVLSSVTDEFDSKLAKDQCGIDILDVGIGYAVAKVLRN